MSSGYVIPIDDFSQFKGYDPRDDEAEEDDLEENGLAECELSPEEIAFFANQDFRAQIEPFLDRIPEREAYIIYMYFYQEKRQADIAIIFNMTQAAVSYRLARGIKRLRFLFDIPNITVDQMREDLPAIFRDSIDIDILVGMWVTTCQSLVAEQLGLTQGVVRHHFFKAVIHLQEAALESEKFAPYSEVFNKISSRKFNILREVQLPQWSNRGGDELT
jgi:hypothetical protein